MANTSAPSLSIATSTNYALLRDSIFNSEMLKVLARSLLSEDAGTKNLSIDIFNSLNSFVKFKEEKGLTGFKIKIIIFSLRDGRLAKMARILINVFPSLKKEALEFKRDLANKIEKIPPANIPSITEGVHRGKTSWLNDYMGNGYFRDTW